MTDLTITPRTAADSAIADSYWKSLRYFSVYRMIAAMVFLVAFLAMGGQPTGIANQNPTLFLWTDLLYVAAAFAFLFALQEFRTQFNLQLTVQVVSDVIFLTVLMYASGGAKSGIAVMLLVAVAGAALVGQGRLTLLFAAIATMAVLVEQGLRVMQFNANADDFLGVALTSVGFFATAIIAQLLARKVVANENLARQRGIELADQVRINRKVIEDMDDGVLVVDQTGRVRLHNPQAELFLGASRSDDDTLIEYSPVLAGHLQRQTGTGESQTRLTMPNGRTLQVRWVPPKDGGGNALIYLQDLGRIEAQAQQIKLAALGRLTANIAHEIRNPLAAITSAGELLADEQRSDVRVRLLRMISENSLRLNRLVGEVLELGRRDRAQPETIPLDSFFRQFVDEMSLHEPIAAGRVSVKAGADLNISFDRTHLYRILVNLVDNALRYASDKPESVRMTATATGAGYIEIHVLDDGPGISEDDRIKVFEPFFTTHTSGTGLGLYIARELCEANGAHLDLVDEPEGGAHFRILAKEGPCLSSQNGETEAI